MLRMAYPTKLGRFIERRGIRPVDLARKSRKSRRHIYYLLGGEVSPTLECMLAVKDACAELTGRDVEIGDLFEIRLRRRAS